MRAILKEGLLPETNTNEQSSDFEVEGTEENKNEQNLDVEMKVDGAVGEQSGKNKNVKNRQAYFGGLLLD